MPRRPISLASCLRSNFVRRSKSVIFIVHARDLSNQLLQLRAAAERAIECSVHGRGVTGRVGLASRIHSG
jgi:hypothetical protein